MRARYPPKLRKQQACSTKGRDGKVGQRDGVGVGEVKVNKEEDCIGIKRSITLRNATTFNENNVARVTST